MCLKCWFKINIYKTNLKINGFLSYSFDKELWKVKYSYRKTEEEGLSVVGIDRRCWSVRYSPDVVICINSSNDVDFA